MKKFLCFLFLLLAPVLMLLSSLGCMYSILTSSLVGIPLFIMLMAVIFGVDAVAYELWDE